MASSASGSYSTLEQPPTHCFVSPSLTIQSEAGGDFLGIVAEPIVAGLLPHCIPLPHVYTLLHTVSRPAEIPLLPLLINYSRFCQDTCMRAHSNLHIRTYNKHTHTNREKCWRRGSCWGWTALSSGQIRSRHHIIPSRLDCSVTGTVSGCASPAQGEGGRKEVRAGQNWRCTRCQREVFLCC